MTPEYEREYRRRQRARATATAVVLGGLAILFFAITIVRMG
jgi:hypothetical protein